jgi:hypothetical protein
MWQSERLTPLLAQLLPLLLLSQLLLLCGCIAVEWHQSVSTAGCPSLPAHEGL